MRVKPWWLALTVSLFLSGSAAADIYHYVDADGTLHFTNRPQGGKYKLYMKTAPSRKASPGVNPVAPSDRDPTRYTRYDEWIRQAGGLYQIPEELIRSIIRCESDYDPRAVSPAGARGLMQLMPETAAQMQVRDIDDPRENIFGGVRYLRILANQFNGDLALTVAGYNAGDGAVMRYGGIPPYQETQDYVISVLKFYRRYRLTQDAIEASLGQR